MRQGSASRDGPAGRKREPIAKAINPKGVSQIGSSLGNHTTDHRDPSPNAVENVFAGRGYEAPMRSVATHKSGSQRRS